MPQLIALLVPNQVWHSLPGRVEPRIPRDDEDEFNVSVILSYMHVHLYSMHQGIPMLFHEMVERMRLALARL